MYIIANIPCEEQYSHRHSSIIVLEARLQNKKAYRYYKQMW